MKRSVKRLVLEIGGVLLFVALALAAIWSLRSTGRSAVLADRTCDPPCWLGITPGSTSCWGAQGILEQQPLTDSLRQWDTDGGAAATWRFRFPFTDGAGYLYCADDRVAAVQIVTVGALNLSQALGRLGEPEWFWLRAEGYAGTEGQVQQVPGERGEERQWIQAVLVYPYRDRLVRVDIELPAGQWPEQIDLSRNSPVGMVIYLDPDQYDALLDSGVFFPEDGGTIAERLRPWTGLGPVEVGLPQDVEE